MGVKSIVDYDAWRKGYVPPSEHVLIDELSYRGAKVVLASTGGACDFWLVIKQDRPLSRKQRKAMLTLIEMGVDELDHKDDVHPLAASSHGTGERD